MSVDRVNIVGGWTGRKADALRQAFRMPIEQFASRIGVSTRTVAGWREHPNRIPHMEMQEALDVVLENAADRVKALFATLLEDDLAQRLELTPDENERVSKVIERPTRLDAATIRSLSLVLAGQRRAEDVLGPEAIRVPMTLELKSLQDVLKETAGPQHDSLARLIAEWTNFVGWLHTATGKDSDALELFTTAEEITDEVENGTAAATATSFKGYVALLRGHPRKAIRESAAALATPGAHPTQHVYDLLQTAQAYAGLGGKKEAQKALAKASDLTTSAGEPPDSVYWYTEPFFRLNIGLAQLGIGQHRAAADSLRTGITDIPEEQQSAEWMNEYLAALARAEERS
jgi:transcriptional regulator with XRE-family HTH domain